MSIVPESQLDCLTHGRAPTPAPTAAPSSAPTLAPTLGEPGSAFVLLDTTVDLLDSSTLMKFGTLLANMVNVTSNDVAVTIYAGSVIIKVEFAGGAVDGAGMAASLESAWMAGTLTSIGSYSVLEVSTKEGAIGLPMTANTTSAEHLLPI